MAASWEGQSEIAHLLIEEEADVNAQNNKGRTALMYASGGEDPEVAQLLIEAGVFCFRWNRTKRYVELRWIPMEVL